MKNLSGRKDCDRFIRKELNKASIPIVARDLSKREVPASIAGQLGPFSFERGWYYWVVRGPMPLHVARKLYRHPEGHAISCNRRRMWRASDAVCCADAQGQGDRSYGRTS